MLQLFGVKEGCFFTRPALSMKVTVTTLLPCPDMTSIFAHVKFTTLHKREYAHLFPLMLSCLSIFCCYVIFSFTTLCSSKMHFNIFH
eukprot:m.136292 g.136292  ORF g.136292 m.136292 type:complete len:87 (-) comp13136_c0_seq4:35-295(-)